MSEKIHYNDQSESCSLGAAMSRRDFLISSTKATLGAACFVVLNPFATDSYGLGRSGEKPVSGSEGVQTLRGLSLDRAIYAMGTIVSITAVGKNKSSLEMAIEAAFDEIRQVEKRMSVHDESSELSTLNRAAGEGLLQVDRRVVEVVDASLKFNHLSGGMLEVTILPLMRLWGFHGQRHSLPGGDELQKTLAVVNSEHIRIDYKNQQVGFKKKGVQMDFGGVAKGFAVDRAAQALREHGVSSAIINGGGDIYAMGSPPDAEEWLVGITNPMSPGEVFAATTLKDAAMATSGNYEQYRIIEGKKYAHLIHPKTGLPVSGMLSATVVAPTTLEADALSTAAFVFGQKQGTELLQDLPQIEGVLVGEKGPHASSVTAGLKNRIRFANISPTGILDP